MRPFPIRVCMWRSSAQCGHKLQSRRCRVGSDMGHVMRYLFVVLLLGAFALSSSGASAEETRQQAERPAAPAKQEMQIENATLIVLIKSTIMALQHANQTGNYSVLRDMGTPIFRERYDQAALTAAFANLRTRHITLNPVLFLPPNLVKQPEMTAENELHLVGNFSTQPLQIQYDLLFLNLDGAWRLNGFAVDAVAPQAVAASQPVAAQTASPAQSSGWSAKNAAPLATKSDKKRADAAK